jgi:3-deoxy-D-manno-octulosonic-acid transferase
LIEMAFLYDIAIRLYYLVIFIVSPFNLKARLWLKGRKHLFKQLQVEIKTNDPIIWFHASSLGEFEQGRPVIEAFKKQMPEYKILLTFFSPSGYEIRKKYPGADYIFYLPLDTRKNARKFIDLVNPQWAVFIKYDFWFNFLNQLSKRGIRTILISARFRQNQSFFKSYGFWYRKTLKCFDHLFVQDQQSIKLLSKIHIDNVTISGDTRFDRVSQIAAESHTIHNAEKFTAGKFSIVCGSTWGKDEDLIARYINESSFGPRFIIAPHEIHQRHIKDLQEKINKQTLLYSEFSKDASTNAEALVIDNIGMLSSLFKYGQIAYIGGGFGAGIHNILEAAVYGIPVIFGPNYQKFLEANELISHGGAFSISSYLELKELFDSFQTDKNKLQIASKAAKQYVINNLGSTEKIIKYLTGS